MILPLPELKPARSQRAEPRQLMPKAEVEVRRVLRAVRLMARVDVVSCMVKEMEMVGVLWERKIGL